jgi:hypothetical protein
MGVAGMFAATHNLVRYPPQQYGKRLLARQGNMVLTSQPALAIAYRADGQTGKAVELLEHVVIVRERTLAGEHVNRLAS